MRVYRGLPNVQSRSPCVLTIGNFDGVHRGHQALLAQVRAAADARTLPACVMTFEPHPREFFAAAAQARGLQMAAPARLANLRDKLEALSENGIDRVIVEHFNNSFASQSPQHFIDQILVNGCHARWVMVGEDFCFGARRAGNVELLRDAGQRLGFEVLTMPTVTDTGMPSGERISSSAVREALHTGNLARAEELLGHPYFISGRIIHGKKLGRTIGFPTANIAITHRRPALEGIFVVRLHGITNQPLPGVASLGVRPTLEDNGRVLLETYLLDFAGDLYGKLVRVEFLQKLHDERKYPDLETLTAGIDQDVRDARAYFENNVSLHRPPLARVENAAISATDRIS